MLCQEGQVPLPEVEDVLALRDGVVLPLIEPILDRLFEALQRAEDRFNGYPVDVRVLLPDQPQPDARSHIVRLGVIAIVPWSNSEYGHGQDGE